MISVAYKFVESILIKNYTTQAFRKQNYSFLEAFFKLITYTTNQ